ncbi:hypothetical protein PORY_000141 [Pneumocystis oryctolagi]|uniref:Uncharacterized protein n=1 Tax=Pneumocystis oryctolagi TaxID=42067 RepID=A0ACB7CGE9_9ASCO|nr:hypothetical protein PORY_000141 [Pneumocystis oryctolagi]
MFKWRFFFPLLTLLCSLVLVDIIFSPIEKETRWLLDVASYPIPFNLIEKIASELNPLLKSLTTETDYFKYYRLNLFGTQCSFWGNENGLCSNYACMVDTLEESELPEAWKPSSLGKIRGLTVEQPHHQDYQKSTKFPLGGALGSETSELCVYEESDRSKRDYCIPEDESTEENIVYVSLVDNPERYTGYSGPSAHQVWRAIYRENCFVIPYDFIDPSKNFSSASKLGTVMSYQENWGTGNNDKRKQNPMIQEQVCLEKRVFYRIISGMHASISTHLCKEYLNKMTGSWEPNLQCFMERVGNHSDRIENIYFNYVLILRALAKLHNYLKTYTFCEGDINSNAITKVHKVNKLIQKIIRFPSLFDERLMFDTSYDSHAMHLKDEFRMRFRNVSKLMDCVSCDKCRLWGKIQVAGFGTALKVLFEFNSSSYKDDFSLKRTELVALVNTFDRVSSSIQFIQESYSKMHPKDGNSEKFVVLCRILSFFQNTIEKIISYKSFFNSKDFIKLFSIEYNKIKNTLIFIFNSWLEMFRVIYIHV